METKFNIGDKVKILDGSNIPNYLGEWNPVMSMAIGMTATVNTVMACSDGRVGYFLDDLVPSFDERGLEKVEEKAPEPYSGKIIFTKGDCIFETGHIYEIVKGKIRDPRDGHLLPGNRRFTSIEDVKDYFTSYLKRKNELGWDNNTLEFIEVIE